MASKLDQAIANVAIAFYQAGWSRPILMTQAAEVAAGVKPKDLAKFPDKWYPGIGAKAAGAPDLADPWQGLWFEAMAEILCQKKAEGAPGLLTYWERDEASDHHLILIRLLRLAADGIETQMILDRVRTRLQNLHIVKTRRSVEEVVQWAATDPRPLKLLEPMGDIVVPNSDGDTVGKYIRRAQGIYD